jgi:hypothetical protein
VDSDIIKINEWLRRKNAKWISYNIWRWYKKQNILY